VTHQLQYVKAADQVVVLKNGSVLAKGSYLDLLKEGIDLFKYSATEAQTPAQVAMPNADVMSVASTSELSPQPSQSMVTSPCRFRMDSLNSDVYRVSRTTSFVDSDVDSLSNYDQISILDFKGPLGMEMSAVKTQPRSLEVGGQSNSDGPSK